MHTYAAYIYMYTHVSIHKEYIIIHNNTHTIYIYNIYVYMCVLHISSYHPISLCCVGRCMSFNMCCGRLFESTRSGREAGSPTIGECHALADE